MISRYDLFYRGELNIDLLQDTHYDVFISAYNEAERVSVVFDAASADKKIWLLQPEYELDSAPDGIVYEGSIVCDEANFVIDFWDEYGSELLGKKVCIDITGFIRPTLLFLIRFFYAKGLKNFDLVYSEPDGYNKGESTRFASKEVAEVRTIEGYSGTHVVDTSKDILIVGAGYDHHLISRVAENRDHARKYKLFGFPSLRADMFQENLLKVSKSEEYLGNISQGASTTVYAPAYDPFLTASEISKLVRAEDSKGKLSNLYLSPLSTKPQTVGFALFYILECIDQPVSLIFPFCERYNPSTSVGISRIWRYEIEL